MRRLIWVLAARTSLLFHSGYCRRHKRSAKSYCRFCRAMAQLLNLLAFYLNVASANNGEFNFRLHAHFQMLTHVLTRRPKRVATSENVPLDIYTLVRLKLTCAFAQCDQSLHCPHEETLHPWLFKMRPVTILIRLRECAGWSESLLGTHFRKYVFWHCGSNKQCSFISDALTYSHVTWRNIVRNKICLNKK